MSIGDVARQTGIRPSAIRYYESVGVLPEPPRVAGQRRYGTEVLNRLSVVRMAKDAGLTVAEIVRLFHGFEPSTGAPDRWRALAEQKMIEIDEVIARAERMRHLLSASLRCACLTLDDCALAGWTCVDKDAN